MDPKTKWTPEGEGETPYRRARQEWDDRMGSAVVQAKNWRTATFVSLGAVLTALVGLVYLGAQPKAVPHIIEVDRLGAPTYRGPVAQGDYVPPDAAIKYHLHRFLEDTRTISSDIAVVKRNWLDAYTLCSQRGGNMLTTYVQAPGNDPFRRALEERVTIEIISTVRVSADTWQLDWRETLWDKAGQPQAAPVVWRAMLRTLAQVPKTEAAMIKNPLGLYIDEFHWDKVQG